MKQLISVLCILYLIVPFSAHAEWFKGNTHAHTIKSDGDSSPEAVVEWYRDHGYNFLMITDHNITADVEDINKKYSRADSFIVIPGNEISADSEQKPVHMNALNITQPLTVINGDTIIATLQRNIDAIHEVGGLVTINHPNFIWAFGAGELLQVDGYNLLEIYNFHPQVNNHGGGGMPSTERIWDTLLSRGKKVYGLACDDTHTFKVFSPAHANPGRGWVWVQCDTLTPENVISALSRGDFYFSSGVELKDISAGSTSLTVEINPSGNNKYTVEFIGDGGQILSRRYQPVSVYTYTGDESYVRARITDSNGLCAWTQPVFLDGR